MAISHFANGASTQQKWLHIPNTIVSKCNFIFVVKNVQYLYIKRQNKQGLIWQQPVTVVDCLDLHRP